MTRNLGARITYQASQRNKFNIFWDEGMTCQDPCDGAVAAWQPREGTWTGQTHPARLQQVSWTNPLTGRILLDAGLSMNTQLYDFSHHRYAEQHPEVPRVEEFGLTIGADEVAPQVNSSVGPFATASGFLNNGLGGAAEWRRLHDYRWRASASYVTGTHSAKIGYDAAFFSQIRHNSVNDTRWTCRATRQRLTCNAGNHRRPPVGTRASISRTTIQRVPASVPTRITINTGVGELGNHVGMGAVHSGPVDAQAVDAQRCASLRPRDSSYAETCVGPDPPCPCRVAETMPARTSAASRQQRRLLRRPHAAMGRGVDLFGTGKTSIKWSMGKYWGGRNYRHLCRREPGGAHRQPDRDVVERRKRRPDSPM
jgi:hypothetical protein